MVDGFARTEAAAGVVFGVFVGSMTAARLSGSALIDRFGRVRVLVASGISSLSGLMLFGLAPGLLLAALGVAAWGLGAGLVVPIGMAAVAGDRLHMAGRVAVLSACASVASIVAPPVLGMAAESMGARHALMLVGVGMAASILLARTVRRPYGDARPVDGPAGVGHRLEPFAAPPAATTTPVTGSPVPVGTC